MKISEMKDGEYYFTQLASTALAVLVKRVDGWAVYIAGVPGYNHYEEAKQVKNFGDKAKMPIAKAIAENLFYPPFTIDEPYAY